jgi:cytochrome c
MRTTSDPSRTSRPELRVLALALASWLLAAAPVQAADTTAAQQLDRFNTAAGAPGQAERGRVFFTTAHGGEWSCASCHGTQPVAAGRHASTGKALDALAPGFNPRTFTDTAKVDKWFRRNCKDVLQRECSAAEKADVLAYLLSLKP